MDSEVKICSRKTLKEREGADRASANSQAILEAVVVDDVARSKKP